MQQSSQSFQTCRVNWSIHRFYSWAIGAGTFVALGCISLAEIALWLQIVLGCATLIYSVSSCLACYKKPSCQFFIAADGQLVRIEAHSSVVLQNPYWRDFAYVMELRAEYKQQRQYWYWWTGCLSAEQRRQLRRFAGACNSHTAVTLPSIITNPVL